MPIDPTRFVPLNLESESSLSEIAAIGKKPMANPLLPKKPIVKSPIGLSVNMSPNIFTPDSNSRYDQGITLDQPDSMGEDIRRRRFQEQGGWSMVANTLGQTAGTVVGDIVAGTGALLEFPVSLFSQALNGAADFENALTELGDSISEGAREKFPVYKENDKAFQIGSASWWLNGVPSIASTLSILVPALGQAKAIGAIGSGLSKLAKMESTIAKLAKYPAVMKKLEQTARVAQSISGPNANRLMKTINLAASQRVIENYREASQTWADAFDTTMAMSNEEFNRFLSTEDGKELYEDVVQPGDTPEVARERIAKEIASSAAWKTFRIDSGNFAFDFIQTAALTKAFKLKGFTGNNVNAAIAENARQTAKLGGKVLEGSAFKIAKDKVGDLAYFNAVRPAGLFAIESITEGMEEIVNGIAQQEGAYYAKNLLKLEDDSKLASRLGDYLQDPTIWEQGFWGTLGGATFAGVGAATTKYQKVVNKRTGTDDADAKLKEIATRQIMIKQATSLLNQTLQGNTPDGKDKLQDIKNEGGVVVKTINEQIEERADEIITSLAVNLKLNALRTGNADLLDEMYSSPEFKESIAADLKETGKNVDALLTQVKDIFKDVDEAYNSAGSILSKRVNDDVVRQILIGKYINSVLGQKRNNKHIADLENKIAAIQSKDTVYNGLKTDTTKNVDGYITNAAIAKLTDYLEKKKAYAKAMAEAKKKAKGEALTGKEGAAEAVEFDKQIEALNKKRVELTKEEVLKNDEATGLHPNLITFTAEKLLAEVAVQEREKVAKNILTNPKVGEEETKTIKETQQKAATNQNDELEAYLRPKLALVENATKKEDILQLITELEKEKAKITKNEVAHWSTAGKAHNKTVLNGIIDRKIKYLEAKNNAIIAAQKNRDDVASKNIGILARLNNTRAYNNPTIERLEFKPLLVGGIVDPDDTATNRVSENVYKRAIEEAAKLKTNYELDIEDGTDEKTAYSNMVATLSLLLRGVKSENARQAILNRTLIEFGYNDSDNTINVKDATLAEALAKALAKFPNPNTQQVIDFNADKITQEEVEAANELFTVIVEQMGITDVNNKGKKVKFNLNFDLIMQHILENAMTEEDFITYFPVLQKLYLIIGAQSKDKFTVRNTNTVNKRTANYYTDRSEFRSSSTKDWLSSNSAVVNSGGVDSANVYLYDLNDLQFTRNNSGDLVLTEENDLDKVKFLLNTVKPGTKVRVRINTEFDSYEEFKDNKNKVPIVVEAVKDNNDRITFAAVNQSFTKEEDGYVTMHNTVKYTLDDNDYMDRIINNETVSDAIEGIFYELLEWYKVAISPKFNKDKYVEATRALIAKDTGKILNFLMNLHDEDNKLTINSISPALLHISKVIFFGNNTFSKTNKIKYDQNKINNNLINWKAKLLRDYLVHRDIRNKLNTKTGTELNAIISYKGGSTIIRSQDAEGNTVYRRLTDSIEKNIEDLEIVFKDKVTGMLRNADGSVVIDKSAVANSERYEYSTFVAVKSPNYDANGNPILIPLYIQENTVGRHNLEGYSKYGAKLASRLYELVMEAANYQIQRNLVKGSKDPDNIKARIAVQKRFAAVKKAISRITYVATKKGESTRFLRLDANSFGFDYVDETGNHTVRIFLANTDESSAINVSIDGTVVKGNDQQKGLTNALSRLYGRIDHDSFTFGEHEDALGTTYKSYTEYLVKTGLAMTNVGKLVDVDGNKISNFSPRADSGSDGNPLTLHISLNDEKGTPKEETGILRKFVTANNLIPHYNNIYKILEDLIQNNGVSIKQDEREGLADYSPSSKTITLHKGFFEKGNVEKSLLVAHEIIHALIKVSTGKNTPLVHERLSNLRTSILEHVKYKELVASIPMLKKELEQASAPNEVGTIDEEHKAEVLARYNAAKKIVDIMGTITVESKNLEELVTYGLTDTDFASFLDTLESTEEIAGKPIVNTIWQQLKDIIRTIIDSVRGITKLDELASTLDLILENIDNTKGLTPSEAVTPEPKPIERKRRGEGGTGIDPTVLKAEYVSGSSKNAANFSNSNTENNSLDQTVSINIPNLEKATFKYHFDGAGSLVVDELVSNSYLQNSELSQTERVIYIDQAVSALLRESNNLGISKVLLPKLSSQKSTENLLGSDIILSTLIEYDRLHPDSVDNATVNGIPHYSIDLTVSDIQPATYESFIQRGSHYKFTPMEQKELSKVISRILIANKAKYVTLKMRDITVNEMKQDVIASLDATIYPANPDDAYAFTNDQLGLLNKAMDDLEDKHSELWEMTRRYMSSMYNIDIAEDLTDADYADQMREWSDTAAYKEHPSNSISEKIKNFINNIVISVPKKAANGHVEFEAVRSDITGLTETLDFKAVNIKLHEILSGAYKAETMLARIEDFGNRNFTPEGRAFLRLHAELLGSADLTKAFVSYYNKSLTQKLITIVNKIDANYQVKNFISNKDAFNFNALANEWVEEINTRLEEGTFNDKWTTDTWVRLNNDFRLLTANNFSNGLTLKTAQILSNIYEELGIIIDARIFIDQFIRMTPIKFAETFVAILGNIKQNTKLKGDEKSTAYIDRVLAGEEIDFTEKGRLLAIAERVDYYSLNPEGLNSTDIKNNVVYVPQWHHFVSDFMTHVNDPDQDAAFEFLKDYAKVDSNQYSILLWGNQVNVGTNSRGKEDYYVVEKGQGTGLLDYTIVDGKKTPVRVNKANISKIHFYESEGFKNQNLNIAKEYEEYTEVEWNILNMLNFKQSINYKAASDNNPGNDVVTLPMIIESDRSRFGFFEIPRINLGENAIAAWLSDNDPTKGKLSETVMFNRLKDVIAGDITDAITATSVVFEIDPDTGLPYRDLDNNPVIRQEVLDGKVQLQQFYHFQTYDKVTGKPIILDKNGKPTGNAFKLNSLVYKDATGIRTFNMDGLFVNDFISDKFDLKSEAFKLVALPFVKGFIQEQYLLVDTNFKTAHKFLNGMFIDRNTGMFDGSSVNNQALAMALNSFLFNIEQQRLFLGTNSNYAPKQNFLDLTKRAAQIGATKRHGNDQGKFLGATVMDIKLASSIITNLVDDLADSYKVTTPDANIDEHKILAGLLDKEKTDEERKKGLNSHEKAIFDIADNYMNTNTTDGVSLITKEEFIKRLDDYGMREEYQSVIDKLEQGENFSFEDRVKLIQMQKNFYYAYKYDENLKKFVPNQVKNAEVILTDKLVAGLQLESLYTAMKANKIVQVNLLSGEKVGATAVAVIHDELGNILPDVEARLKAVTKGYYYDSLGKQQDIVDHLIDEENTLGVQIAKKVLDNIIEDTPDYMIDGKMYSGRDIIRMYFQYYDKNIEESAIEVAREFIDNVEDLEGIIAGTIEPKINFTKIRELLIEDAVSRGMNANAIKALQNDINAKINMPLYYSMFYTKWQSILTSIFTNNITKQKFPGVHITQMSTMFVKPLQQYTYAEFKEKSKIQWLDGMKEQIESNDFRLKAQHVTADGSISKAQVLLPRWTQAFFSLGQPININDLYKLDPKLLTMVGYRIPTEDKHSTIVFEVVGFLPDEISNIVLPDEFVTQSGADFDIDTLYTMMYNTESIIERIAPDQSEEAVAGNLSMVLPHIIDINETDNDILYERYFKNTLTTDNVKDIKFNLVVANQELRKKMFEGKEQVLSLLTEKGGITRKDIKDHLIKKGLLHSKGVFNGLSLAEKQTLAENKQARQNAILDIYVAILTHKNHKMEMSTPNGHPDISIAQGIVEGALGLSGVFYNPPTYFAQAEYRKRNMSGKTLKAFSVSRDGFLSVAQRTGATTNPVFVEFEIDETIPTRSIKFLSDRYRHVSDRLEVNKDGKVVTIAKFAFTKLGNNLNNDYLNADGKPVVSYSAQTTAHILDGVKDVLPNNVNPVSFGILKTMVDLGIPYLEALAFLNTPPIIKAVNTELIRDNVAGKEFAPNEMERLLGVIYAKRLKDNGKVIEGDMDNYVRKHNAIPSNLGTTDLHSIFEALGLQVGVLPNIDTLLSYIKNYKDKGSDVMDVQLVILYNHLSSITQAIGTVSSVINTDKKGAGPTLDVTSTMMDTITKKDSAIHQITGRHGTTLVHEIYPSISETPNAESTYSPLHSYFKYANKLSYNILSKLFITENPKYAQAIKDLRDKIKRDPYAPRNTKRLIVYINKELYRDLPFFQTTDQELKRLLGITTPKRIRLTFNSEEKNLTTFKKLSLGNKINLYKNHLLKQNGTLYGHILNNVEVKMSKTSMSKNGYVEVSYKPVDIEESVVESFNQMWYSENPYERSIARDLVRYGYHVHNLAFTYTSIAKVIPTEILASANESVEGVVDSEMGIGLATKLEDIFDTLNREDSFLELSTENFVLKNYKDDSIIPSVHDIKIRSGERDEDGSFIMVKLFVPNENGVIVVDEEKLAFTKAAVHYSDYVKLPVYINNKLDWKVYKRLVDNDNSKNYYIPINKLEVFDTGTKSLIESNNTDIAFDAYEAFLMGESTSIIRDGAFGIVGVNLSKLSNDPINTMLELDEYVSNTGWTKYPLNMVMSRYKTNPVNDKAWVVPTNPKYANTAMGWYVANVNSNDTYDQKIALLAAILRNKFDTYPAIEEEIILRGGTAFLRASRYIRTKNMQGVWEGTSDPTGKSDSKSPYIVALVKAYTSTTGTIAPPKPGTQKAIYSSNVDMFSEEPQAAQYSSSIQTKDSIDMQALIDSMTASGDLIIDCTGGATAAHGMFIGSDTFGDWEVVSDLKGMPKHSAGGVDLTIGEDGSIDINDGNGTFKAKDGMFIPGEDPTDPPMYSASVPPVEVVSTPTGRGRFLNEYEQNNPYKPYTTTNQYLAKYQPNRMKLAEESNRKEYERKRNNYADVKMDEEERIANIGKGGKVSGMNLTPEQKADVIRTQSANRLEWKNKDPLQKIIKIAGETALALTPELLAMKGASTANTVRKISTPLKNASTAKKIIPTTKPSNAALLQYLKDTEHQDQVIKEIGNIQHRISNMSFLDTKEMKQTRMLARDVPDYTNTMNAYTKKLDKIHTPFETHGPKGQKMLAEEMFEKEAHYPSSKVYKQRIKNTEVKAIDQLMTSHSRIMPRRHLTDIRLGVKQGDVDPTGFNLGTVLNHELDHSVSFPTVEDVTRYKEVFDFKKIKNPYYSGKDVYTPESKNMTEIKARLGQLKDLLGKKGTEQVTMDELDAALIVLKKPNKYGTINNHRLYSNTDDNIWDLVKDKNALLKVLNDATKDPRLTAMGVTGAAIGLTKKKSNE